MDAEGIEEGTRRRRLRGWRAVLLGLLVLLILLLLAVWLARFRVATYYVDRELARRGVEASYQVRRIGWGRQVLENLVIGDPQRPDATARRVEVQVLLGLNGPRVGLIRARGVRLFGRIRNGRLTLGQVDRLLPPPSGLPFRLPDQRVDVEDAAIALATPAGKLGIGLSGRGNLSDGFRGRMALVANRLQLGACTIDAPRAAFEVSVADLRPSVDGPLTMSRLACGGDFALTGPAADVRASFAPALDRWRGFAGLRLPGLTAPDLRLREGEGQVSFAGNARRTSGRLDLTSGAARLQGHRANSAAMIGSYRLSLLDGAAAFDGRLDVRGLQVAPSLLAPTLAGLRGVAATPFGPVASALASALSRAARGAALSTGLRLVNGRGFGGARVSGLQLLSASGARLAAVGTKAITYYWPSGRLRLEGDYALSGGGFPSARLSLREAGSGRIEGLARIAPMRAGSARLQVGDVAFNAGPDGVTRFRTSVTADGPIGEGRVTALTIPLTGRFGAGGLRVDEDCVAASFRSLQVQSLALSATRLRLCPIGPALIWQRPGGVISFGARSTQVRLAGRLGGTPLRLSSQAVRLDGAGFAAQEVNARLGDGTAVNRLDVDRIDARFVSRGLAGGFAGLSGKIAAAPLLIDQGVGRWQLVGDRLSLSGRLRVSDAQDPLRFQPLHSPDFALSLIDGRIRATGSLDHPGSQRRIALAKIDHDLTAGAGQAILDVPGIVFDPGFQPEALTPLTVGVVALVRGQVEGQGRISWDGRGTRSSGTFSTADMDLAAPFGPVEGLKTRIHFTDLLGLVSAPGQIAEIELVRPGVDIYDGRILFQLQPDYRVAVESGRWPYAGGELILRSTLLDFSQESTKRLNFQVVGLDAARFITAMEFSNISATGTFDGEIPMEFGQGGGQIIGGRLAARQPGGTLSYIGELTDRDLGIYGKMAFDALKALRYDRLDLTLDGALDGEFITTIDLDGIARNPGGPVQASGGAISRLIAGRVISQLATIPFEFNIRIKGPFRAVIATARSFEDPSLLIQPVLPRMLRDLPTSVTAVQDEESETKP